jgi:hypothetical protein
MIRVNILLARAGAFPPAVNGGSFTLILGEEKIYDELFGMA